MASMKEFRKKMFKFIIDFKAETISHDAITIFRRGSTYPVKSESSSEIIIEIGADHCQFRVPKYLGIIGPPVVIFAEITEVKI